MDQSENEKSSTSLLGSYDQAVQLLMALPVHVSKYPRPARVSADHQYPLPAQTISTPAKIQMHKVASHTMSSETLKKYLIGCLESLDSTKASVLLLLCVKYSIYDEN